VGVFSQRRGSTTSKSWIEHAISQYRIGERVDRYFFWFSLKATRGPSLSARTKEARLPASLRSLHGWSYNSRARSLGTRNELMLKHLRIFRVEVDLSRE
jgi:hypothetical protein